LQNIISNVLLFSQLDAGRVSLDDTPFKIRQAIMTAASRYTSAAAQKGVSFETRIAETVPLKVIGDHIRVTQILDALLDNAVKFTDAGTIKLTVHGGVDAQGHAALLVTVSDTGIGIAESDQERIFERFTQEDGSIKRRHGGTGLGLTVARGLAELMGGALTVKSALGEGSTFTVRLAFETEITEAAPLQAAAE
jgi:signal transduction histidine kinase